ncbi:hypothetical protein ACEWY4_019329 [Coilia grayii]|uniref:ribonuclease H n=1 Tax=Coilia grayii TaxID=363190 RepID=A0ABD1JG24_9TELE
MPKFCSEEVDVFFDAFEKLAKELQWPQESWPILVQSSFTGKALEAYATLDALKSTDYEQVKQVVLLAYEVVPEGHKQRFRSLRRKPGETYLDLIRHQEAAFERWLKGVGVYTYSHLRELILLEQFKLSIPRHVELHINDREVTEVRKAAMMADSYELAHREPVRKDRPVWDKPAIEERHPSGGVERFSGSRVHSTGQKSVQSSSALKDMICHYCRKPGHIKSWCPVLEKKASYKSDPYRPIAVVQSTHELVSDGEPSGNVSVDLYEGFKSVGTLSLSFEEQGAPVSILRDTGAAQSVLLQGVVELPESASLKTSALLKGLGGEFQAVPLYRLYLDSELVSGEVTLGVVPSLPIEGIQLLLGNDLAGERVSVSPIVGRLPCEALETKALEAEYPAVFSACVVTRSQAQLQKAGPTCSAQPVSLGDTQIEPVCCVVRQPELLDEDVSSRREPVSAHLQNSAALSDLPKLLHHLTPSQQSEMQVLIKSHLPLFRDRPSRTSLTVHDVETGDATPIKQHPYRVHPNKLVVMKEELAYMVDIGAVESSQSAWSSPVVLIPKSDGSTRFCIDYRKVNTVTKTDAYPIPRLEDCIDQIGKAEFVTKLDLLKGYWQVPLSDHAKDVSAFVTPQGLFRCLVLPFGMKNSPATFQRLMNQVTSGLDNVVAYIDDLIAFSFSWADHVVHLGQLFDRLESAGLVVNLPKCELGKARVTYLGHQVA